MYRFAIMKTLVCSLLYILFVVLSPKAQIARRKKKIIIKYRKYLPPFVECIRVKDKAKTYWNIVSRHIYNCTRRNECLRINMLKYGFCFFKKKHLEKVNTECEETWISQQRKCNSKNQHDLCAVGTKFMLLLSISTTSLQENEFLYVNCVLASTKSSLKHIYSQTLKCT